MKPPNKPGTIHQFHYCASQADAVTGQMLWIQTALRQVGIGGEIFCIENKTPPSSGIRQFTPAQFNSGDLALIHHSHGNPDLARVLNTSLPKALIYHNVTPSHFFKHDPHLAEFSNLGRRQIAEFRGKIIAAFGDSRYNCSELEVAGLSSPEIFPLLNIDPHPAEKAEENDASTRPRTLCFVGKQAPHKNQALLIQSLAYLQNAYPDVYRLVLVGRADPLYGDYLRLLSKALRVEKHVTFTGPLSNSDLETVYQTSSALVCASLHEGFCIPLVEAMRNRLAVFALPTSGVRETLGQAGVRLVSREPAKIAESIHTVLENSAALSAVLESQVNQLDKLSKQHSTARLQSICTQLLGPLPHTLSAAMPELYV